MHKIFINENNNFSIRIYAKLIWEAFSMEKNKNQNNQNNNKNEQNKNNNQNKNEQNKNDSKNDDMKKFN